MRKLFKIIFFALCFVFLIYVIFGNSGKNSITGNSIQNIYNIENTSVNLSDEEIEKKYFVEGPVGRALILNKNRYIVLDYKELNTIGKNDFTIQGWFAPGFDIIEKNSRTYLIDFGVSDIIYKGNPYGKWISFTPRGIINEGGVLWFQFDDNQSITSTMITSKTNIKDGKWHHGAVVFERKNNGWSVETYIDGILENRTIFDNYGLLNSSEPMVIGRPFYDGDPAKPAPPDNIFGYSGLVDEFYVFNRKLSSEEIKESYNSGKLEEQIKISNENLLVYLSFEENDEYIVSTDKVKYRDDYNEVLLSR